MQHQRHRRHQRQPSAASVSRTTQLHPTTACHAHQGASQHHAATDISTEARRCKDAAARRAVGGEEQQRHACEDGHRAREEEAQAGHGDEQGCRGGRGGGDTWAVRRGCAAGVPAARVLAVPPLLAPIH